MVWDYFGQIIDMQLLGGFVGVQQDATTLEVTPALGWAVYECLPTATPVGKSC